MNNEQRPERFDPLLSMQPLIAEIVRATVEEVVRRRVCSDHDIANIVAEKATSPHPVPPHFLPAVSQFVSNLVLAQLAENKKVQALAHGWLVTGDPRPCYVALHHGQYHYGYDSLPDDVIALRDKMLFWIDHTDEDYRSRGRQRKALEPRVERMLSFVCYERNAGRTVPFVELYEQSVRKVPPSTKKMVDSIQVIMSALNRFVGLNMGLAVKHGPNAYLLRHKDTYRIHPNLQNECCIISVLAGTDTKGGGGRQ